MVNKFIYNKLSAITTKVYPDIIPIGVTFPAIMYELLETNVEQYKGGNDVTYQTWAVHVLADSVRARNDLATQVKDALTQVSDSDYWVENVLWIGEETGFEPNIEKYVCEMHFEIRANTTEYIVWDFEGTLTAGELAVEGFGNEYGYRAGWGDDYGTFPNFYTHYQYAGCYWFEGFLYIWGVSATDIMINGNITSGGSVGDGYTSFEMAINPFTTGEDYIIKVNGTATETWDYEGILTVGSDNVDYIGYYYGSLGKVGSISGYCGDLIRFNISNFNLELREATIIKIDDYLINGFSNVGTTTSHKVFVNTNEYNPFPAVGETCTIKIKL